MKERIVKVWSAAKPVLLHPLSYVLSMGFLGAMLIVVGVGLALGLAASLVCAGFFMLLGARYVSKGMTNG